MTNLINQISINGKTTTFLNYVNPIVSAESVTRSNIITFVSTHLPSTNMAVYGDYQFGLRFPVPWETLTGQVGVNISSTTRFVFSSANSTAQANTTNSNGVTLVNFSPTLYEYSYAFGVINDYAIIICYFSNTARTSNADILYLGWARDKQFTGNQFPRNIVMLSRRSDGQYPFQRRVTTENTGTYTDLLSSSPTLLCSVSTPGANASEIILRDSASPNNYIGQCWNMIRMPSSCQQGKIYKNTGIDPDTGQVETDQKAFWMCVGNWGTDKIGMRVWTDNVT